MLSNNYSRERRRLVSVKDALQLMLAFGNLIIALVALIVELIKLSKKNNRQTLTGCGYYNL
ncbi:putative holin-like toxin [Lactobacillus mellis]|nr:putative holin-like toxin [Bombilactobacillus mellis]